VAISGPTTRPLTALRTLAAGAALLTLALAGCSGSAAEPSAEGSGPAQPQASQASDGPRLVQGGAPGEAASDVPADTTLPGTEWSHDDEMFMQMMIPHHAQALTMTGFASTRAADRRVKLLAQRIEAAQGPEIEMMAAWLEERELRVPAATDDPDEFDHGNHGHTAMAGMLTDAELAQLEASSGRAFDRMFLESMISHHEGAISMADDTAPGGLDPIAVETREGVSSSQSAEIGRMRLVLSDI
jgi:uncharacterized protein (DUF305 family)